MTDLRPFSATTPDRRPELEPAVDRLIPGNLRDRTVDPLPEESADVLISAFSGTGTGTGTGTADRLPTLARITSTDAPEESPMSPPRPAVVGYGAAARSFRLTALPQVPGHPPHRPDRSLCRPGRRQGVRHERPRGATSRSHRRRRLHRLDPALEVVRVSGSPAWAAEPLIPPAHPDRSVHPGRRRQQFLDRGVRELRNLCTREVKT